MRACCWLFLGWIFCSTAIASDTYIVQKGDTLYRISRRFHITVQQLIAENHGRLGLHAPLKPGQHIAVSSDAPKITSRIPQLTHSHTAAHPVHNPADGILYIDPRNNTVDEQTDYEAAAASHEKPSKPASTYLFINRILDKLNAPAVKPGRWKYIVVHHSGTTSGNARIFDYFHRHVRGMENGLAYHFVIGNGHDSGDGQIEVGNRWMKQLKGGHVHSDALNEISLGICFVGDFNRDRPTKKQIAAALELIGYLNRRCGKQPVFKLHREINPVPTQCPGTNFPGKAFHQLFDQ